MGVVYNHMSYVSNTYYRKTKVLCQTHYSEELFFFKLVLTNSRSKLLLKGQFFSKNIMYFHHVYSGNSILFLRYPKEWQQFSKCCDFYKNTETWEAFNKLSMNSIFRVKYKTIFLQFYFRDDLRGNFDQNFCNQGRYFYSLCVFSPKFV